MECHFMTTLILSGKDGCDTEKCVRDQISLGNPMNKELEVGQAEMPGFAMSGSASSSKKARMNAEEQSVNVEANYSPALSKSDDVMSGISADQASPMDIEEPSAITAFSNKGEGNETEVKWSTRPVASYAKFEFKAQDSSSMWGVGGSLKRCRGAFVDLRTILDAEESEEEDEPMNNRARFSVGGNDEYDPSEEELLMQYRFRPRELYTIIEVAEEENDD